MDSGAYWRTISRFDIGDDLAVVPDDASAERMSR